MTQLDIGIASYQNPKKLEKSIQHIIKNTTSEWRLFIVDNDSPDPEVRKTIDRYARQDERIVPVYESTNTGYAGAVNKILELSETTFVAYVDNDAYVPPGWDADLLRPLQTHHEVAMSFPNGGHKPIQRADYMEVLWGIGFCWILNRQRYLDIGGFDTDIGHQEEVDFQMRLRLAGWKIVGNKSVNVHHEAHSSRSPEARKRINDGIERWVNKWNAYFGGRHLTYHSPNVIRFDDWNVNAVYLDEYFKQHLPGLNADPETVTIEGQEYDLIKVPRFKALYRDRII